MPAPNEAVPPLPGWVKPTGLFAGLAVFALLLALPAPDGLPVAGWRVVAVVALMAVWWVSEALPIAVTALVPLAVLPLLGVAEIGSVAAPYANPLVFLLLGGFMLGLALQRNNLHRRLALYILRSAGGRADRLIAGFMAATALLSMWISNTATAAMMVPIGLSVILLVEDSRQRGDDAPTLTQGDRNLPVALLLGIAFAANIGGTGTLIGTPPNALLAGYMAETHGIRIGFAQWMLIGVPVAAALLAVCWAVLTRLVYPVRSACLDGVGVLLGRERVKLGGMTVAEKRVAAIFAVTAAAWLARPLLDRLLPGAALSDAGIAMLATLALFVVPAGGGRPGALLDWPATRDLPWAVLLLIGGGLSLGTAIDGSGLAGWIGAAMTGLAAWPLVVAIAAAALAAMLASHVTSNTATAAALVPVVSAIALSIGAAPLQLAVPVVLAASCALMLPVATPPNAIVAGTGHLGAVQMARGGAVVSVAALAVIVLVGLVLVDPVLGRL